MTINIDDVTAAMERAVALKGADYVYPDADGCRYSWNDGTPACIVGHVAADLWPDKFKEVADYERVEEASGSVDGAFVFGLGEDRAGGGVLSIQPDRVVRNALQRAQNTQDNGFTWGEALAEYKKALA